MPILNHCGIAGRLILLIWLIACGKDLEKETFDVYLIDKKGKEKKSIP